MAEWLAAAGDVSSAFVSERSTDDVSIYRRIAISVEANGAFSYLIHTPQDQDIWIVLDVRHRPEVHQFDTLVDALDFVRPVLGPPKERQTEQRVDQEQAPPDDRPKVPAMPFFSMYG